MFLPVSSDLKRICNSTDTMAKTYCCIFKTEYILWNPVLEETLEQGVSKIYSKILGNVCETSLIFFCVCTSSNACVTRSMRVTWHIWINNYCYYFWAAIDHANNFRQDTLHSPFISKKKKKTDCALHRRYFWKHPLFTTFWLVLWMEVCYISNKYQPPSNLAKYQYFYTRDFVSLLHFIKKNKKKMALSISIANVFRNIHFLPYFHYF